MLSRSCRFPAARASRYCASPMPPMKLSGGTLRLSAHTRNCVAWHAVDRQSRSRSRQNGISCKVPAKLEAIYNSVC